MQVIPHDDHRNHARNLQPNTRFELSRRCVKHGTGHENGKVERGEVVVQEELAGHEEEGEVMQSPASCKESAELVVFNKRS